MLIRNEKPEDYRIVEEMIKKAFWNLSVPGCLLRGKCVSGGTYGERIRERFFFLFSPKYNIIIYNVNILN